MALEKIKKARRKVKKKAAKRRTKKKARRNKKRRKKAKRRKRIKRGEPKGVRETAVVAGRETRGLLGGVGELAATAPDPVKKTGRGVVKAAALPGEAILYGAEKVAEYEPPEREVRSRGSEAPGWAHREMTVTGSSKGELTVDELRRDIKHIQDPRELERVLRAESRGKNRKTAKKAIRQRIRALEKGRDRGGAGFGAPGGFGGGIPFVQQDDGGRGDDPMAFDFGDPDDFTGMWETNVGWDVNPDGSLDMPDDHWSDR